MNRGQFQRVYPSECKPVEYEIEERDGQLIVQLDGKTIELNVSRGLSNEGWCQRKGELIPYAFDWIGEELHIWVDGTLHIFRAAERAQRRHARATDFDMSPSDGRPGYAVGDASIITSRISGRVLIVSVSEGDKVSAGDEACVIEAMKMEHSIRFTTEGVVKAVHVSENQQVSAGDALVELELNRIMP